MKSYNLGRRGSNTASIQLGQVLVHIPEHIDDADGSGFTEQSNYEHDRSRKSTEKDRRRGRKIIALSQWVTQIIVKNHLLPCHNLLEGRWSCSKLATSPGPVKSLSSKTSFVNGDEHMLLAGSFRTRTRS